MANKKKDLVSISFELGGADHDQLPGTCNVAWSACYSDDPSYGHHGIVTVNLSGSSETLETLINDVSGAITQDAGL